MAKYFKCITNKAPVSYVIGEEIEFEIFAEEDGVEIACDNFDWKLEGDDGKKTEGNAKVDKNNHLMLKYTLERAGFVHLYCVAKNSEGEKVEGFDELNVSVGANVEELKYSDTVPEDFGEYWTEIEKLVADTEVEVISYEEKPADFHEGYKAFRVMVKTPCGRPASGCVTIPNGDNKYPIRISFLGYGVHAAYFEYDENKICAVFNAHGFENDKTDQQLEEAYRGEFSWYGFDEKQNASKYDTYFRNMMIRNLIGLKYCKTLAEWNGKDIISNGGSQGALQAVTIAAHDKDVTVVEALKPWFCDLNAENEGYLGGWRPKFAEGLRYFDTVAQGMHLDCPITIECYLGDYVCPPKTVMALYNSIKSPKKIIFIQAATHSYFPPYNPKRDPDYILES